MSFVVKAPVSDLKAKSFSFDQQKVMYGGKGIGVGDEIFVFDSENEGGEGLIARGVVTAVAHLPVKKVSPGVRRTPRVSIKVKRAATARRRCGRLELKPFRDWGDGRPETEIAFKLYRQATNKIVGISEEAAAFLRQHF
jgi:hypothetical protein